MKTSWYVLALFILPSARIHAQSLENAVLRNSFAPVGAGARAAGMGGAFLAIADDGTAASFNPAGLAQLRKPELAFVGYDDKLSSSIDLSRGVYPLPSESDRHSVPQFLGFAKPIDIGSQRLTFQLSYERTVDLVGKGRAAALLDAGQDPSIGPAAYLVELQSEQSGAMHTLTASAGLGITDELMVGASASYWIGEWKASGVEEGQILLGVPPQFLMSERIDFRQEHSLRGINLNVGSLFRKSWFSLGGVLRLPFSGRYVVAENNTAEVANTDASTTTVQYQQGMRTILRWPLSAGVGVAVRPLRGLTLAADAAWTHWETMIIENVPNGALMTQTLTDEQNQTIGGLFYLDRNFFDLFPASESFTGGTGNFRVGAEYLVNLPKFVVPLRVGHAWEESPVPELGVLGARRIAKATLGIGINFRRVAFDIAWERSVSSGSVGATLGPLEQFGVEFPSEDVTQERVITSFVFRF